MKPPNLEKELEYCRQSLMKTDYDHYLISLFMPLKKRQSLWVLGAFREVIETIPLSVSDPALGYMRLTWWRDQIAILERGGLTKGQPVLSAIQSHLSNYNLLSDFINEHEAIIETPEAAFNSTVYPKLLQLVLGPDFARYQTLETKLTEILKSHHGTKWERNPPFLALRLLMANLFT